MVDELPPRSRAARDAAEKALMRVVHHYGGTPEFVVLGGLVPEMLCTCSEFRHVGTIDVDVQVGLEIACGAVNAWNKRFATPASRQKTRRSGVGSRTELSARRSSSSSCRPTSTINRRKRRLRLTRAINLVP